MVTFGMNYPEPFGTRSRRADAEPAAGLRAGAEQLALILARRGLGQTWPNPSVGAVVLGSDGKRLLSYAHTSKGGRPHAEALALAAAGAAAEGGTLVVTLEPCSHHGVTPPCADAIVRSRIARVIYGIIDPDPRVSGAGIEHLRRHGVRVEQGAFAPAAYWLGLGHAMRIKQGRPFVQVKLAVGSDGLVPRGEGGPQFVTGSAARAHAHLLRAEADAIAVGSGTLAADDPQLTCRLPGMAGRSPVRVVLSGRAALEPGCAMLRMPLAAPVWLIAGMDAPQSRVAALLGLGVEVLPGRLGADGRIDLSDALRLLARKGITRLLVEGGPSLASAFVAAGLADEILIFQGAAPAGSNGIRPFEGKGVANLDRSQQYRCVDVVPVGGDTIRVYRHISHIKAAEDHVHGAHHGGRGGG